MQHAGPPSAWDGAPARSPALGSPSAGGRAERAFACAPLPGAVPTGRVQRRPQVRMCVTRLALSSCSTAGGCGGGTFRRRPRHQTRPRAGLRRATTVSRPHVGHGLPARLHAPSRLLSAAGQASALAPSRAAPNTPWGARQRGLMGGGVRSGGTVGSPHRGPARQIGLEDRSQWRPSPLQIYVDGPPPPPAPVMDGPFEEPRPVRDAPGGRRPLHAVLAAC